MVLTVGRSCEKTPGEPVRFGGSIIRLLRLGFSKAVGENVKSSAALGCLVLLTLLLFSVEQVVAEDGRRGQQAVKSENDQIADEQWISENTGKYLPLDAEFVDEHGNKQTLGSLIDRPTLILPIYFYCPSSCSLNLANLAVALNRLNAEPGRDYRVIALSFSETEKPDNARRAKQNYLKLVDEGFPAEEWKFLTGSAAAIKDVTQAMGYRFKKMADGTYMHPSALVIVDGDGKIIRYVYGSFIAGDIDMAIASAREGVPMLSVKRLLDFCFNYDPRQNNPWFLYVKIAVLIFFGSGVGLIFYFSRKKKAPCQPDH